PGVPTEALVLSPHGHVEHHLVLTDDGSATWIHVEPGTAPALLAYLESMKFWADVVVEDVTASYGVLSVVGGADTIVARASLPPPGTSVSLDGRDVGFLGTAVQHFELGPIALAVIKRQVADDAHLMVAGMAASAERLIDA